MLVGGGLGLRYTAAVTDETEHPWKEHLYEFELADARIVATLGHDGGAIVENVRKLFCYEGRLFAFETTHKGNVYQLEYTFKFASTDEAEPFASKAVGARIVISGIHSNGLRLEIRGDGWIGYDEEGHVEGNFDLPPILIPEDDEPDPQAANDTDRSQFDWPMPPQFNQADIRVPVRNEWDELE